GDKVTIPAETPTKDGYKFLGWATDPESGKVTYTPGQEITAEDMRLYAVWEQVAQDIQIRFDAHGGTGGPEAINAKKGDKVTIPAETPTKDGYKFLGWATDPESGKVTYTPGQEITAEDMRLYAVWEQVAQDIQIRFDAHGGTGGPEAINAKKGDKVTIPAETPTKDGYKFLGWATDPESGKVTYTPGQEITAEDMRLYAVWEQIAQDIQIRFDAHGGTGGPSVINAKKGDKVTIPAETPTKDGYKFLGWATDPESGKVTYTPGQEITAEDMRLYAVWEKLPQKYKLMFDANGGSEAPNTVESNEKGAVKIPANTPKRDGYTFVGWGKTPASSTADYKPNQEITITSDTKLYAVWTENGKKVVAKLTFNANGGTGAPNAINAASDGSVTIPTTGPYRNGYKFLGWSKDAKAKEASYKPGDKLNIYADTTLYAIWQSNNGANTGVNNNSTLYLIGGGIALAAAIGLLLMKKKNNGE
ncbi:MAG: InlB B-repeat-containing protein, partial [Faecalicoccus sp.]|nr:InlB B-repeat-containing protein [Faecalicoccus sp.]